MYTPYTDEGTMVGHLCSPLWSTQIGRPMMDKGSQHGQREQASCSRGSSVSSTSVFSSRSSSSSTPSTCLSDSPQPCHHREPLLDRVWSLCHHVFLEGHGGPRDDRMASRTLV